MEESRGGGGGREEFDDGKPVIEGTPEVAESRKIWQLRWERGSLKRTR